MAPIETFSNLSTICRHVNHEYGISSTFFQRRSIYGLFGREGFCQWQGSFYLMPKGGPHSTVYRFALPGEE